MGYKVVIRFMDLEDNNFIYEEGWDFPRANHFVSEQRIKELSTSDNRQGMPLIVESGEVKMNGGAPREEPVVEEIAEPIIEAEPVAEVQEELPEKVEKPKKSKKKK